MREFMAYAENIKIRELYRLADILDETERMKREEAKRG